MSLLLVPLSIVFAVAPMVALLLVVWWLDRYNREPLWLFGLTFLWGGIGGVLIAFFGSMVVDTGLSPIAGMLDQLIEPGSQNLQFALGPTLLAPLVEEPAKALFLLPILMSRQFDNLTDGFVYGAAAGLGFGMTENAMYFLTTAGDPATWLQTVVIRTMFSAVMHGTSTALVGVCLGWGRFHGWKGMLGGGAVGLAMGMGIHALWNGLLVAGELVSWGRALYLADIVLLPLEVLLAGLLFQICLLSESRILHRELNHEVALGTLPPTHPAILSSWLRRQRYSWLPAGVDHHRYVRAATTLALRRNQLARLGPRRDRFFRDDIERLRRQVRRMLQHADERFPENQPREAR